MSKIFGYDWETIRAAQQGDTSKLHPALAKAVSSAASHKAQIERDIERHKLSVYDSVVKGYGIVLPEGYKLEGELWVFTT